jgi:hypothetical protein
MILRRFAILSFITGAVAAIAAGQTATKDIKAIFDEGKIADGRYTNAYFGLTLTLSTNARFTQGGFVSSQGKRARLVAAERNSENWNDRYEVAVLADTLSANPLISSPDQYVRSVRHQFEREGSETVQAESPAKISGAQFVYATMKVTDGGLTHYRGIYTTFLNGYILSLDVSAASLARLQDVLKMVDLKAPAPRR